MTHGALVDLMLELLCLLSCDLVTLALLLRRDSGFAEGWQRVLEGLAVAMV